jgi:hypothetical protein
MRMMLNIYCGLFAAQLRSHQAANYTDTKLLAMAMALRVRIIAAFSCAADITPASQTPGIRSPVAVTEERQYECMKPACQ